MRGCRTFCARCSLSRQHYFLSLLSYNAPDLVLLLFKLFTGLKSGFSWKGVHIIGSEIFHIRKKTRLWITWNNEKVEQQTLILCKNFDIVCFSKHAATEQILVEEVKCIDIFVAGTSCFFSFVAICCTVDSIVRRATPPSSAHASYNVHSTLYSTHIYWFINSYLANGSIIHRLTYSGRSWTY